MNNLKTLKILFVAVVLTTLFLSFIVEQVSAVCCQISSTTITPIWGGPPASFTGSCTYTVGPTSYAPYASCTGSVIAPACTGTCRSFGDCSISASAVSDSFCPY